MPNYSRWILAYRGTRRVNEVRRDESGTEFTVSLVSFTRRLRTQPPALLLG